MSRCFLWKFYYSSWLFRLSIINGPYGFSGPPAQKAHGLALADGSPRSVQGRLWADWKADASAEVRSGRWEGS